MGVWTQQRDGFWTYRVPTEPDTLRYAGYVVRDSRAEDEGAMWVAVLAGARGTQDHIVGRCRSLAEARHALEAMAVRGVPHWLP